ncbi:MAG: hypothetical protein ABIT38_20320 [Gemmatimonadaceae bacterium]
MTAAEFVASIAGFSDRTHADKIKLFGWYLLTYRRLEDFRVGDIRDCYDTASLELPVNLARSVDALAEKKPPELLKKNGLYRLHATVRADLNGRYGQHETTIQITRLLKELPGKVSDDAERLFLSEAITCYSHRAFRAAIVMTWNLAYDHLLNWLIAAPARIAAFNASIAGRIGPKKAAGMLIVKREDFEELKEGEVLDICSNAGVFPSSNIKKLLDTQLTKRNMAAHPSLIVIGEPEANETINTLVSNVVLKLL